MSKPNPRWNRWITSSIAKYLKTDVVDIFSPPLPFLVEGIDDREDAFETAPDRAECRVNGPFTQEQSARYWRLWVDINVLLTSTMGEALKNKFTLEQNAGLFHEAMDTCIPIYRTGSPLADPENDGTLVGHLRPRKGRNDSVRTIHFGQINKVDRLRQAVVDGRYVMYVRE